MMTTINVAEAGNEKFECDTAASHNIMSQAVYDKLRNRKPDKIPRLKQEKLAIRLADGSVSSKQCGTINIKVQGSNTKVTSLDFFIMDGPNNLLGRLALEKMWPEQYRALREITEVPVKNVKNDTKVPVAVSNAKVTKCSSSSGVDGGSRA